MHAKKRGKAFIHKFIRKYFMFKRDIKENVFIHSSLHMVSQIEL